MSEKMGLYYSTQPTEILNSNESERTLIELGGIPIDRVAWRVIRPGEHYERPKELRLLCFDVCPMVVRGDDTTDKDGNDKSSESKADLSGMRFGRLTVIGNFGRSRLWVCRCLCGLFTVRSSKVLRRGRWRGSGVRSDVGDMCNACLVEYLVKAGIKKHRAMEFTKTDAAFDVKKECLLILGCKIKDNPDDKVRGVTGKTEKARVKKKARQAPPSDQVDSGREWRLARFAGFKKERRI